MRAIHLCMAEQFLFVKGWNKKLQTKLTWSRISGVICIFLLTGDILDMKLPPTCNSKIKLFKDPELESKKQKGEIKKKVIWEVKEREHNRVCFN